jgi:hypothetical protein
MHPETCPAGAGGMSGGKPRWEVADVFRRYGDDYRRAHRLSVAQRKVMRAIEACRTERLGGHVERCDACGYARNAYNSCRNRHCPKCQTAAKERWLEARTAELLPVGYYHLVFTLPHELNPLAAANDRIVYELLFQAASETLTAFGRDPRHRLGGRVGFLSILHTWDQQLRRHVHLHVLMPAGALSEDGTRWIPARKDYLFPIAALSKAFRGKFLGLLKVAYHDSQLVFPGHLESCASVTGFARLLDSLWRKAWVVYAKPPFAGPRHVLAYLGRYTHRVAISNHRIVEVRDGHVAFRYRDRADGDRVKVAVVPAESFIRRFLAHVLPGGFQRIRHYGFLGNRAKKRDLPRIREALGCGDAVPEANPADAPVMTWKEKGLDASCCPACRHGVMRKVLEIRPVGPDTVVTIPAFALDSS